VLQLGREPNAPWITSRGPCQAQLEAFDLHANITVAADDRAGVERLCRYVLRPPVAQDRLSLTPDGLVLLTLKAEWHDGTTHLLFTPVELLEKLAALTPRPRIEAADVLRKILGHLGLPTNPPASLPARPPPSLLETEAPMEKEFQRWTAKRKVELLLQLIKGEVKLVDACREHALKQSEVEAWMETFVQGGERSLKARSEDEQAVHEREVRELRAKVGELVLELSMIAVR
jgi:transposase-like protein